MTSAAGDLADALIDTGAPGLEILGAYIVKEDLRALRRRTGTHPDRRVISGRLYTFYNHAAASTRLHSPGCDCSGGRRLTCGVVCQGGVEGSLETLAG